GETGQVGTVGRPPIYLKVARKGATLTAYTSRTGSAWAPVPGSTQTSQALAGSILAGLAADAHHSTDVNTTRWTDVFQTKQAQARGLPTPWQATALGGEASAGAAGYGNAVFTITSGRGAGGDPSLDRAEYVHEPATGDGALVARIGSRGGTTPPAGAGLMFRASTARGSAYAAVQLSPSGGVRFQTSSGG